MYIYNITQLFSYSSMDLDIKDYRPLLLDENISIDEKVKVLVGCLHLPYGSKHTIFLKFQERTPEKLAIIDRIFSLKSKNLSNDIFDKLTNPENDSVWTFVIMRDKKFGSSCIHFSNTNTNKPEEKKTIPRVSMFSSYLREFFNSVKFNICVFVKESSLYRVIKEIIFWRKRTVNVYLPGNISTSEFCRLLPDEPSTNDGLLLDILKKISYKEQPIKSFRWTIVKAYEGTILHRFVYLKSVCEIVSCVGIIDELLKKVDIVRLTIS